MIKEPCQVNLIDEWEIVQYIRDLLNLYPLLERGFDAELLLFIKQLRKAGWGTEQIRNFIVRAGQGTRYEQLRDFDGKRIVPRALPEKGDQREWLRNKGRVRRG